MKFSFSLAKYIYIYIYITREGRLLVMLWLVRLCHFQNVCLVWREKCLMVGFNSEGCCSAYFSGWDFELVIQQEMIESSLEHYYSNSHTSGGQLFNFNFFSYTGQLVGNSILIFFLLTFMHHYNLFLAFSN